MPKVKVRQHRSQKTASWAPYLVIGGVILLIVAVLILKPGKGAASTDPAGSGESAQAQLDRALAENRPTLAFFHSNNCQNCIIMMETVEQVYPEFAEKVALVDINVYDESNEALLKRVGLQYIPTLIFYDHTGKEQVSVGVMEAEQLRQILADLAGGN